MIHRLIGSLTGPSSALVGDAISSSACSQILKVGCLRVFQIGVGGRNYSDAVKDHFRQPRNVGSLDPSASNVGTATVGKAACGDVIRLQVQVDKNDVIQDVKFKAFGCGSAIASSSLASELIKGKKTDEALGVKNSDIASSLALPPVKFHCSLLAEDAIKRAIQDFKSKQHSTVDQPQQEQ